ncbi:hypothetical protein [Muribacter muris]|nr:hypothetical protein [Muribacter muris]
MKKQMIKILASLISGALFASVAFAQDPAISRYEQAKLPLAYEGEAGHLLQQLAQRLKVGFISYELDGSQKVSVQNQQDPTIKALIAELESKLSGSHIRFEKIGSRLFLVASAKNGAPLLLQAAAEPTQFIGEAVFSDTVTAPENVVSAEPQNVENAGMQALKQLVAQLTDQAKIAQHKGKKAPQYKVSSKERLGLQTIRVTPLGTFLIFNNGVATANLNVKGKFEQLLQQDNVIVISHQTQNAPAQIEIKDKQGKTLTLKNTLAKSK